MNINIYDKNLSRIIILQSQFVSCYWEEGYNTCGVFTLELQDSPTWRDKIKPDYYVGRDDRRTLMVVKTVEIKGGLIIVSGAEAKLNLDDVAFLGTIDENSVVSTALMNAYATSTGFPNMTFANSGLPDVYAHQISNKSMLELCYKMCQDTNIGFVANRFNNTVRIELYKPAQNPNLVFSEDYGNLNDVDVLLSTMGYKNKAIVMGADEERNATFSVTNNHLYINTDASISSSTNAYMNYSNGHLYVDSTSGEAPLFTLSVNQIGHLINTDMSRHQVVVDISNGVNVREMIVDARDLQVGELTEEEYEQALIERGVTKLAEATQTWNCTFQASEFGTRYDLGDTLTVLLKKYGIVITARVVKFAQTEQRNQLSTMATVGELTIRRKES